MTETPAAERQPVQTCISAVRKLGRVGGFADGDYDSKCLSCGVIFVGDKRATSCLPCAVARLQARCSGGAEPVAKPEPNPEWEALADSAHASIRKEAGDVEPEATLTMLKTWKAHAEPANELGQISFSRALLDSATDALEFLLSPQPQGGGDWPEREADLRWLDRQRDTGHCGESTSEVIQRGRINACIDRIKDRLSTPSSREALKAAGYEVALPEGYQYGPDAMENVRLGARLATDAILARLSPEPGGAS